jgi:hypothetical protein
MGYQVVNEDMSNNYDNSIVPQGASKSPQENTLLVRRS